MNYIFAVQTLWAQGDRAQAAFWYYVWQIRTRPWVEASGSRGPYAQARGALTQTVGPQVNEWVFSDPKALIDLTNRAISYEAKLPLYAGRPADVSEAQWPALVAAERAKWAKDFEEFSGSVKVDEIAATRRQNGLRSGPWEKPGKPLPEDWR